jgi:hypothetical protein
MIYTLFTIINNNIVTFVGNFSSLEKALKHIKFQENDDIDHREDEYSVFRELPEGRTLEYLIVWNEMDEDVDRIIS